MITYNNGKIQITGNGAFIELDAEIITQIRTLTNPVVVVSPPPPVVNPPVGNKPSNFHFIRQGNVVSARFDGHPNYKHKLTLRLGV